MKKFKSLFWIVLLFALAGCSSSDNNEGVIDPPDNGNDPGNSNDPPPAMVTYTDDIRTIISSNCTSCHSNPPTQQAPMSLVTYDDLVNAVENRGLLTRINSSSNPMPPTGRLPAATRELIQDWVDLDYPE